MIQDYLLPAALSSMAGGGLLALLFRKKARAAEALACAGLFAGILLALYEVCRTFGSTPLVFFQLPILVLSAAGAIHSLGYLKGHGEERAGLYFFFYNLTAAAMYAVTLAQNPILFLVAWEGMGLASFALVAFDYKSKETLKGAWIYLLGCQAGSMFLIPMFLFPGDGAVTFALAVIGFGLKIGFPLLHVWLPLAHPAAPAPVSSLMSGAMIQLGFYGIFRWGLTEGNLAGAYGTTFLVLGILGSLGGILYALPRRNLKTLLAYSSIENMGIISLGCGIGFLGVANESSLIATTGFAGAAFHMLNHALLKGGLFLGAGSVQRAAGTLDLDQMGGLLKRMPKTGTLFLLNSTGICGLPPFNAFIGEFLIYLAALGAITSGNGLLAAEGCVAMIALALTGGFAGMLFVKAGAGAFLGEPRSKETAEASERPKTMTLPVLALFLLGILLTLGAPFLLEKFVPSGLPVENWKGVLASLRTVSLFSAGSMMLFALILYWRFRLLPGKSRLSGTWDCGYIAPSAKMEYTPSSFSAPLTEFFAPILNLKKKILPPDGIFPGKSSFEENAPDPGMSFLWEKIFSAAGRIAGKVHFLQSGYLHFYILLMTAALIAMLIWGLILPWSGTLLKGVAE